MTDYRSSFLRRGLIIMLVVLASTSLWAQEHITIGKITTDISGKTRPEALLKELQIEEGREFDSVESLQTILNSRTADLINRRIFKEFSVDVGPVEAGIVDIDIRVVDSFTLLPRPMIKYSTDKGLTLGLKMDYYNAFGTLSDHMFQGYWSPTEILFEYQVSQIILKNIHMDLDFTQSTGTTRYGSPSGDTVVEYTNMTSDFTATFNVPLATASPWYFQVEPIVSGLYSYEFVDNSSAIPDSYFINDGFAPGINIGFYTDQVDWVGNLRKGYYFDFMSENLWYTGSGTSDIYLESDFKVYYPLTSWFEVSGRIGGFHSFNGPRRDAGDRLRGVVDYMIYGENGAFFTLQTNFRIFETRNKMGLALYLRPFTDIGYVSSRYWGDGPDAWEYTVGGTAMIYLKAMPSLMLNIDYGWDLKRNMPELIIDMVQYL